ncbi:MAG TPA: hypothetical protein VFJ93_07755 [Gaiellaceae bacterium]|nr:hypothetical protein [Gaiellaceae bacterium]
MCTDRLAGQVAKVEQEAAREAVEKVLSVARLADALETHRIQYRREIDEDREVVYVPDWKETARVLIAALRADTRTEQS